MVYSHTREHKQAFYLQADDRIMKDYCAPLISFFTYLIKSQKDQDLLQLPLTDFQRETLKVFTNMVNNDNEDISVLHSLFYSFTAPPDDNQPVDRWMDSLICFLAISNVCIDGTFEPVDKVTKEFAKWEYHIRSSALHEISSMNGSIGEMERYVI